MQDRTYGIFSHKQAEPTALINVWSEVIIVISFIAFIKMQRKSATYRIILTILGFYTLVLFYTNFKTYQSSGSFGFAVQGRYLFPALPIIYLIANDAILRWSKKAVTQAVYIMITLCVFLSAGLPSYVFSTTPEWHNKNAVGINKRLKDLLLNIRVIR